MLRQNFVPSSFKITKEKQPHMREFISIGTTFIKIKSEFSCQEDEFKGKLDWLLN